MHASKNSLLDHFKLLQSALRAYSAEAILGISDFVVYLRKDKEHKTLYPQFMAVIDGVRQYLPAPSEHAHMFAGWLPYRNKRWPLASDKLLFKQFAIEQGLHTPEFSVDSSSPLQNVIVKQAASSFGAQIMGPFRSSSEYRLDTARREYYEQFIEGSILKIWYWNAQPICMEMDEMPFVTGDGATTIENLILRRAGIRKRLSVEERQSLLSECDIVLRFFGMQRSTVLPRGVRQLIEFRYGTDLMRPNSRKVVDFRAESQHQLIPSLEGIGAALYQAVPEDIRLGTLSTVDCILDTERRLWLLEVNSNPTVHPYVYPVMVASLFETATDSVLRAAQKKADVPTLGTPAFMQST